jgi:hypothetical protein
MMTRKFRLRALAGVVLALGAHLALATEVKVTLTNLAPADGVGLSPLWVGFHNGSFDTFDVGAAASVGIERTSEDGNAVPLSGLFAASSAKSAGGVQAILPGPPAFSGNVRSLAIQNVDLTGSGRYFSYAAMVVLSNDFFVSNDAAKQFDLSGIAAGGKISLLVGGAGQVYDAGTEVNDFAYSLANGHFGIGGGQTAANQGTDEHGVVQLVTGNPYTSFANQGLVPAGFQWGGLNFNAGPAFARIDIEVAAVPEPASMALMLAGLAAVAGLARRRGAGSPQA